MEWKLYLRWGQANSCWRMIMFAFDEPAGYSMRLLISASALVAVALSVGHLGHKPKLVPVPGIEVFSDEGTATSPLRGEKKATRVEGGMTITALHGEEDEAQRRACKNGMSHTGIMWREYGRLHFKACGNIYQYSHM